MLDKNLEDMSIFALREFARRVGVASPTSKKKEQLIAEIIEIREGKRQPNLNSQKHGRPPKQNNLFDPQPVRPYERDSYTLVLEQKRPVFSFEDSTTVVGYVEILQNGTGLMWRQNKFNYDWVYIPSEVVFTSRVITGDLITAELGISDNQPCVKKVLNINSCPITQFNYKRKNYLDFSHILPNKKLQFSTAEYQNLGLMRGESVYFYGSDNNDNSQTIINLLNSCEASKIYVNFSLAEKNLGFVKKVERAELFVSYLTDSAENAKRLLNLLIERAKRLFEAGENVVIVIDDVNSLLEVENALSQTKSLMSLTKNTNALGSITIWAVMKNVSMFDKLYDKRFKINEGKFVKMD